jgi:YHS domain-containing protein
MLRKAVLFGGLAIAAATVVIVGCNTDQPPAEKTTDSKAPPAKAEEHGHKPGTHGGILVSLGADSYHAEAVFTKNGVIRLYMLGKDEARIQEVEVQELVGFVTAVGSTDAAEEVKFTAEPQKGDSPGKTSLFVGKLPPALVGKTVQVTINNIQVGTDRFRIAFSNESAAHDESAMPVKKTTEEEAKLFLTPGGKYTAADIAVNGKTIPAVKYNGIRPTHDSHPKPGQKICPISETVSNPKFTWVIGGKTYEFCCIPCIEEFVAKAKEKPDQVKDPSEYVKK